MHEKQTPIPMQKVEFNHL